MPLSRLRLMWEHLFAFAVFASLSLSGVGAATAAVPVPEDLARLEVEVVRVAATGGATVGVGILHLETGRRRIRGALPRGTRVAHKTGTLRPSVVNDVGIVALPGRAGHLVLAVMLKGSVQDLAVQERAIATVSRVVYDHFGASLQPARSR